MTFSLRTRLLVGIVVGMAVLLALFSAVIYGMTRHRLVAEFDASLVTTAKMLSAVVEREALEDEADDDGRSRIYADENGALEFDLDVGMTPEFEVANGGGYFQFWRHDGAVILRSPSLEQGDLPYVGPDAATSAAEAVALPNGKRGRLTRYPFTPRTEHDGHSEGEPLTLAVARDATELYAFLGFLRWVLVNCALAVVVLSAVVGLKVTRAGLRPVHGLANEIASVDARSLEQTFSVVSYPRELAPICERLNELLSRIQCSFTRERQFNADVAHELRTPLAGIQSAIEVCLSRPRAAPEYEQTLRDCAGIVRTMHRLVDALLRLSRLDGNKVSPASAPVGLKTLIEDCWRHFADRAHDRRLRFANRVGEQVVCASDKDHLGMIVCNVLENAVTYCDEGGQITVDVEEGDVTTVVSFVNTGCDLSAEDAARVFDIFWRADASRTNTGAHHGIGLAVVRKVAEALGARVAATAGGDRVFTLRLELAGG